MVDHEEPVTIKILRFFKNKSQDRNLCLVCATVISKDSKEFTEETERILLHTFLVDLQEESNLSLNICRTCSVPLGYLVDLFQQLEALRLEFNEARRDVGRQVIVDWLGETQDAYEKWLEDVKSVEDVFPSEAIKKLVEKKSTANRLSPEHIQQISQSVKEEDDEMFADFDDVLDFPDSPVEHFQETKPLQFFQDPKLSMMSPVVLLKKWSGSESQESPRNPHIILDVSETSKLTTESNMPHLEYSVPLESPNSSLIFTPEDSQIVEGGTTHPESFNGSYTEYSSCPPPTDSHTINSNSMELPGRSLRPRRSVPTRKRVRSSDNEEDVEDNVERDNDFHASDSSSSEDAEDFQAIESDSSNPEETDSDEVVSDGSESPQRTSRWKKCPLCEKWFDRPHRVQSHLKSAHPESRVSIYSCLTCGEQFESYKVMKEHEGTEHPQPKKSHHKKKPGCQEIRPKPSGILIPIQVYWVSQPTPPQLQITPQDTSVQANPLQMPSDAQITSNGTPVIPSQVQITPESTSSPLPTIPAQIIPEDNSVPEISNQIPRTSEVQITEEDKVSVVTIIPTANPPSSPATTEGPKCPHCPLSFFDSDALSKHAGIFHPNGKDRKLRCPKCRESFDIPQFIPHMTQLHPELRATLSSDLRISVAQIQCNFCEMTFTGLPKLKSHLNKRHSLDWDDQDTLKCAYCLKLFYNKLTMDSYIHEAHFRNPKIRKTPKTPSGNQQEETIRNILCSICYRIPFPTVSSLEAHEKTEGHVETLRSKLNVHCNVCRLQFGTDVNALQVHLNSESHLEGVKTLGTFNPDTFCAPCRVDCGNPRAFLEHSKTNPHWKNSAYLGTSLPDEKQCKLGVKCNFCPKSFSTRQILRNHVKLNHKKGGFCCEFCGKAFTSLPDFRSHRRTHDNVPKPFACTFKKCSKSYETKQSLTSHLHQYHSGDSFICSVCGNLFTSKSSLELHERRQHPTEEGKRWDYFCSKCSKGFRAGIKTRRHKFLNHREEYLKDFPHVCLICFHVFKTGEELNESHMGTHDDLKCYMCGKYNSKPTNLENHLRTHTGEKPFFCTFCPSSFTAPYTLNIHMQMHQKYKHKAKEVS